MLFRDRNCDYGVNTIHVEKKESAVFIGYFRHDSYDKAVFYNPLPTESIPWEYFYIAYIAIGYFPADTNFCIGDASEIVSSPIAVLHNPSTGEIVYSDNRTCPASLGNLNIIGYSTQYERDRYRFEQHARDADVYVGYARIHKGRIHVTHYFYRYDNDSKHQVVKGYRIEYAPSDKLPMFSLYAPKKKEITPEIRITERTITMATNGQSILYRGWVSPIECYRTTHVTGGPNGPIFHDIEIVSDNWFRCYITKDYIEIPDIPETLYSTIRHNQTLDVLLGFDGACFDIEIELDAGKPIFTCEIDSGNTQSTPLPVVKEIIPLDL